MKHYLLKALVVLLVLGGATNVFAQATIDSLNQNANQSQGNYQPQNLDYIGMGSLGMMQSAWLDPLQNLGEGQTKPAYSKYYWSPDLVLPVRLRTGMLTLINFPEWELLENVYIGDESTFNGEITGPNTLLLYPKPGSTTVGVDTNVMVFGRSGNKYVFYVRSEGVNTERLTNSVIDIEVVDGQKKTSAGGSGSVVIKKKIGFKAFRLIPHSLSLILRFMCQIRMMLSSPLKEFGVMIFSRILI